MIVVEKAILHVFDTTNGTMILSDEPLSINEEVRVFLEGHITKCFRKTSAKPGTLQETSAFYKAVQTYVSNGDFITFSQTTANLWFRVLHQAEGMSPSDLLICDIRNDDVQYLIFLRINNRQTFVHKVNINGKIVCNELQTQASVPTGSAEESVVFRVKDNTLFISQKKYMIDGNSMYALAEAILECNLKPSQQETMKAIQKTAEKVAEDFGTNPIQAAATVKNAVAREIEEKDSIDPIQLGKTVFSKSPAMQQAFQQKMQDSGFTREERVTVDRDNLMKKIENHKIKTDTGIELIIPAEYFEDTEFIEFNHAEDGSLFITLKHIGSIVNRS